MMEGRRHVVVLGAGVTGLTSAVFLAEAGYTVTVISAHVPGDESIEYASPWAGAHWRTHATVEDPIRCDWDIQTFKYWVELMGREKSDPTLPKSGLKMYPQFHYWDGQVTEELWWAPHMPNYKDLSSEQEPVASILRSQPPDAPTISHAAACDAIALNVPQYLLYLQARARARGAVVFQSRLPVDGGLAKALATAEGIAATALGRGRVDGFVNATGLGAAPICGDETMFPIRGQTVLVRGEAAAIRVRYSDRYTAYCIPRPGAGATILGGTKQKGDWSERVDPETTRQILARARWFAPELLTGEGGEFEVISVQCGLRPAREKGPRVEKEVVAGRRVVHAYGHAGGGYQNSIGSARETLRLVEEMLDVRGSARL